MDGVRYPSDYVKVAVITDPQVSLLSLQNLDTCLCTCAHTHKGAHTHM